MFVCLDQIDQVGQSDETIMLVGNIITATLVDEIMFWLVFIPEIPLIQPEKSRVQELSDESSAVPHKHPEELTRSLKVQAFTFTRVSKV